MQKMKQCPRCARTYSEELSYCLDDGTHLGAYDDNEVTKYSQRPSPPAPTPARHQSSKGPIVIMVIMITVVVGLLGALTAALWWATRNEDNAGAQNINSAPTSYNWSANASPSATASPNTSPSPSPSPLVALSAEKALNAGTYQSEINRTFKGDESERTMILKLQITFNSDGTYLEQGYVTIP